MKTINDTVTYTWINQKSKFITSLYPVYNLDDVKFYLNETKTNYPKATHYCYAYIINNRIKQSDDGEPSGTAGMPILSVLEHQNLNHILCIVTRYFGGIKLGAGGLVRAYTKSVTEALKEALIIDDINMLKIEFSIPYHCQKQVDFEIKDCLVLEKKWEQVVQYKIMVTEDKMDFILENITPYLVADSLKIEK